MVNTRYSILCNDEEYVDDLTITDNKAIEVLQRVHTLDQMIRCGGERGEIGKGTSTNITTNNIQWTRAEETLQKLLWMVKSHNRHK